MSDIKVSVILSVYNGERYLKEAIESILNQSFKEIEIILVNDGSTDSSLDILKEYEKKDNRITIINNEENIGLGSSRNKALKIAKGEYITFVDSDDWIVEDCIKEAYTEAKENNTDITMFQMTNYNNDTREYHENDWSNLNQLDDSFYNCVFDSSRTRDFLFKLPVSACQKIYRRKFLEDINAKFPDRIYFEDNPFFYYVWLKAERISLIKKHLYVRRVHSDSITGNCDRKFFDIIPSGVILFDMFVENGYYEAYKKDLIDYRIDAFRLTMKCLSCDLKEDFYIISKMEFDRILKSPYREDFLEYMSNKNKTIFTDILNTKDFQAFNEIWPPSKLKKE